MAQKVVIITGCSSGIGLETAVLLASDKDQRFKVFATMRNLAKADKLMLSAGGALDKTLFIRELDVTKEDAVSVVDKIKKEEGRVDVLINNAAIGQVGVPEKVPMEQIRNIYETNVFGLIRLIQSVIPGMKAQRSGHIINISSIGGLFGQAFFDIYASRKFALTGFSESLAPVLKQFNVSVSLIEPGPVQTPFVDNLAVNNTGSMNPEEIFGPDSEEDPTRKIYERIFASFQQMTTLMQTGNDVAQIIQEAILAEKPQLHYQTTDILKKMAAIKYVDPTGDSLPDTWENMRVMSQTLGDNSDT